MNAAPMTTPGARTISHDEEPRRGLAPGEADATTDPHPARNDKDTRAIRTLDHAEDPAEDAETEGTAVMAAMAAMAATAETEAMADMAATVVMAAVQAVASGNTSVLELRLTTDDLGTSITGDGDER